MHPQIYNKSPINTGSILDFLPDSGVTECCNLIGDKIGDLKAGDDLSENIGLVTLPKLYARHWPWIGLEENCP